MEKFLNMLIEDEKVREDFLSQSTCEGAYRVAKPYIEDMTIDEFTENLSGLSRALDKLQEGELQDSELNQVSGGRLKFNLLTYGGDTAKINAALKEMISKP